MYKDDLPSTKNVDAGLECWRVKWQGVPSESLSHPIAEILSYTTTYPNINTLLLILCSLLDISCTVGKVFSGLKHPKPTAAQYGKWTTEWLALMIVRRDITVNADAIIDIFTRRHPWRMRMVSVVDDEDDYDKVKEEGIAYPERPLIRTYNIYSIVLDQLHNKPIVYDTKATVDLFLWHLRRLHVFQISFLGHWKEVTYTPIWLRPCVMLSGVGFLRASILSWHLRSAGYVVFLIFHARV